MVSSLISALLEQRESEEFQVAVCEFISSTLETQASPLLLYLLTFFLEAKT